VLTKVKRIQNWKLHSNVYATQDGGDLAGADVTTSRYENFSDH